MIIYDETHKDVTIDWVEEKKDKLDHHFLRREPVLCQLDPMREGKVLRVHFQGNKPAWIDRYIKSKEGKQYTVNDVRTQNGVGFTISDKDSKVLPCPFVKGMIEDWFGKIDVENHPFKEKLLDNLEIVEKNLRHYSELFHEFGLYFRMEEVNKKYGAMEIIEELLVPTDDWKGTLFDFERCVDSLVELREYPLEEEIIEEELIDEIIELPAADELVEEELLENDELLEEPLEEVLDETLLELPVLEVDLLEGELLEEELLEGEILEESLSPVEVNQELQIEESLTEELDDVLEEHNDETSNSSEVIEQEAMTVLTSPDSIPNEEEVVESDSTNDQIAPKIAEKNDAKEGILVGQILLF